VSATSEGLRTAIHTTARVQPGSKIEITALGLREGQDVDVFLIPRPPQAAPRCTALELLDFLTPGPRSVRTWDENEGDRAVPGTITIEEAQANLKRLIHRLAPGEALIITENERPVAKLVNEAVKQALVRRPPPGLGKGFITVISDDDEHLKDFREYMPWGCSSIRTRCTGTSRTTPQLSATARTTIEDSSNLVLISLASYWEIAIKISIGKSQLNRPYEEFIDVALNQYGFQVLPILPAHTARLIGLPFPSNHRDPFDRLLVAQALVEQISMVSADVPLDAYGLSRIWWNQRPLFAAIRPQPPASPLRQRARSAGVFTPLLSRVIGAIRGW
jgi:PIN domain nuclease of toxin-antitoxin system/antitoxin (DNA-binding transcriptional repressor) of toxin-antitoxin stability system